MAPLTLVAPAAAGTAVLAAVAFADSVGGQQQYRIRVTAVRDARVTESAH